MKIHRIFPGFFCILIAAVIQLLMAVSDDGETALNSKSLLEQTTNITNSIVTLNNCVKKTSGNYQYTIATQKTFYRSTEFLTVSYSVQSSDPAKSIRDSTVCDLFLKTTSGKILYTDQQFILHKPSQDKTEAFDVTFSPCNLSSFIDSLIVSVKVHDIDSSEIQTCIFVYRPKE